MTKAVCEYCNGSGRVPTKIYTCNKHGWRTHLEITTTKCVCKEYLIDIQMSKSNRAKMICQN